MVDSKIYRLLYHSDVENIKIYNQEKTVIDRKKYCEIDYY